MAAQITYADFLNRLQRYAAEEEPLGTLLPREPLVDRIKIKADNWGSSSALNVHAAQYMLAVQKDVLSAWNAATGQNVIISNIDGYPFLSVEFEITDGCLDIKQIIKLAGNVMEGLSPKQKMFAFGMLFCVGLATCAAYAVGKLADSGVFDSEEIQKIKAVSKQKESPKVLINNLGGGTVIYEGREWNADDLKKDRNNIDAVEVTESIALDGTYIIDTCKLEGSIHLVSKEGKQFTADFDSLDEDKRKLLAYRVSEALLEKRKLEQQLRIDAKIKGSNISNAHIIDLDAPPREHAKHAEKQKSNSQDHAMQQGSLLDYAAPHGE